MDVQSQLIMLVVVVASVGFLLLRFFLERAHEESEAVKSVKECTPARIRRRVAKAQWRLLLQRMGTLTTGRAGLLDASDSADDEQDCVGVLSLGVGEHWPYQPIPLCAENRQKLIDLGFARFSDDGLWVFYVDD